MFDIRPPYEVVETDGVGKQPDDQHDGVQRNRVDVRLTK